MVKMKFEDEILKSTEMKLKQKSRNSSKHPPMLHEARIYYNTQSHKMHKLENPSDGAKIKESRLSKLKKEIKLTNISKITKSSKGKISKRKNLKSRNATGGMGKSNLKSLPEKQSFVVSLPTLEFICIQANFIQFRILQKGLT